MKVLVLNCGSSSVKYELFDANSLASLLEGEVERIGEDGGARDHHAAINLAVDAMRAAGALGDASDVGVVGHRVVHGGERFIEPTAITGEVLEELRALIPLAPLHNPPNVEGVEAAMGLFPDASQVAIFDTAFHATIPPHAHRYAIPREWYERHGIRRYGFHGTSHEYVAEGAATLIGRPLAELRVVTLHLGNGASASAIANGESVDTSMGMTPLEGLVMGTRCGDLDPALPAYLSRTLGASCDEVEDALNHACGLEGMCGARDMRVVHERIAAGDADAALAFDVYCYRARKYVGAYAAALGGLDALVFTAGVGEHDPEVRGRICQGLKFLGIELDDERNAALGDEAREIGRDGAGVRVFVVPTNEELAIAKQALAVARKRGA